MDLGHIRIAILGGGIAGLSAALALRGQGADVVVLEQAPEIAEVGAGLQISPNGAAVLRALRLEARLAALSRRAQAVILQDYRRATPVARLDLDRHARGARYYLVHRADLIDILAVAAREAGVQIRLLQQVTGIDPGPPSQVLLRNGTSVDADLVIGADGLHSVARAALNGVGAPFFTGQVAWRAIVPNVADLPDEARVWMAPRRHLVAYPLRDGRSVNLVAVQERAAWQPEGWSQDDDPANLRAAFADFKGVPLALLKAVERVSVWGLFRHPVAQHWHGGHLALIGDAAHPTLPFLAQGANLALEDIWALSESLRHAEDIPSALARYQSGRQGRVRRVIDAANGNARKYHLRSPVREVAHMAMRTLGRFAPDRLVSGFDWLYRYDVTAEDWT